MFKSNIAQILDLNMTVHPSFVDKEHGVLPSHAYRLNLKKWQARGGNKELLKRKQKQIQVALKGGLGINVDVPNSRGSGNSNDSNTARRFFRGYQKSAEILGVDEELMKRF